MQVNYDDIAPVYHQRYEADNLSGVAATLRSLADPASPPNVLEVGCGTGRWLGEFAGEESKAFGVDLSFGMLRQAHARGARRLAQATASRLPFPDLSFNFVFCVNALHHFDQPRAFIAEARRLLMPGGVLAIIGMDPSTGRDRWYIYDYFEGTRVTDLRRYPPARAIQSWMREAHFARVEQRVAEHIQDRVLGADILDHPFLEKKSASQLALMTDLAYREGKARIEAAVREAQAAGRTASFEVDIELISVSGQVPLTADSS